MPTLSGISRWFPLILLGVVAPHSLLYVMQIKMGEGFIPSMEYIGNLTRRIIIVTSYVRLNPIGESELEKRIAFVWMS